jgi:hypothetical protein
MMFGCWFFLGRHRNEPQAYFAKTAQNPQSLVAWNEFWEKKSSDHKFQLHPSNGLITHSECFKNPPILLAIF